MLRRGVCLFVSTTTTTTTTTTTSCRRSAGGQRLGGIDIIKSLSRSSSSSRIPLNQEATTRPAAACLLSRRTSRNHQFSTTSPHQTNGPEQPPPPPPSPSSSSQEGKQQEAGDKQRASSSGAEEVGQDDDKQKSIDDSLRETLNRLKGGGGGGTQQEKGGGNDNDDNNSNSSSSGGVGGGGGFNTSHLFARAANTWQSFQSEVGQTWQDLLSAGERKSINKKIHPNASSTSASDDTPYTGPVDMMILDNAETMTAWERMQKRLANAPIIMDVLKRTEEVYEKSGAKKIKERVDDIREDAREAWETSQSPWVYRISSVYDTLTAETAESIAVRELRKLDPDFTLDDWRRDVVENTLPIIMSWWLEGRVQELEPWLGEAVFHKLAAEITVRKKEDLQIDTHVLGIMNSEIIAVEPDEVNKGSPIILLHFMCQQIHCVRKKSDQTIVEGAEDDIRAHSYVAAFQRYHDEEKHELNWQIVDFRFNGAIAYL